MMILNIIINCFQQRTCNFQNNTPEFTIFLIVKAFKYFQCQKQSYLDEKLLISQFLLIKLNYMFYSAKLVILQNWFSLMHCNLFSF